MSLLFFDIDGTLYDGLKQTQLSQKVIDALSYVQEKGHQCFIATGRPYAFMPLLLEDVSFDGYLLANGADITYHNQSLSTKYMDEKKIKAIIDVCDAHQLEYIILTEKNGYLSNKFTYLKNFYESIGLDNSRLLYDQYPEDLLSYTVKIEIHFKDEKNLPLFDEFKDDFFMLPQPMTKIVEVSTFDVSKASGIVEICELLNVDIKDTYCFGDGYNDLLMMKTVGYPVAMGNAVDAVKEVAKYICDDVKNDGIAQALHHLF